MSQHGSSLQHVVPATLMVGLGARNILQGKLAQPEFPDVKPAKVLAPCKNYGYGRVSLEICDFWCHPESPDLPAAVRKRELPS